MHKSTPMLLVVLGCYHKAQLTKKQPKIKPRKVVASLVFSALNLSRVGMKNIQEIPKTMISKKAQTGARKREALFLMPRVFTAILEQHLLAICLS